MPCAIARSCKAQTHATFPTTAFGGGLGAPPPRCGRTLERLWRNVALRCCRIAMLIKAEDLHDPARDLEAEARGKVSRPRMTARSAHEGERRSCTDLKGPKCPPQLLQTISNWPWLGFTPTWHPPSSEYTTCPRKPSEATLRAKHTGHNASTFILLLLLPGCAKHRPSGADEKPYDGTRGDRE